MTSDLLTAYLALLLLTATIVAVDYLTARRQRRSQVHVVQLPVATVEWDRPALVRRQDPLRWPR